MGSINFWMCLILTICTWHKTFGCTWMRTLPPSRSMFQVFSNNTITVLREMGHVVSREPQITFPYEEYRHVDHFKDDDKIVFISQTLNAIEKLYRSDNYDSFWDQKVVDEFMIDLHRQTSELDQCVKAIRATLPKSDKGVNKNMSLHFKFLNNYLKREEYSASGWEGIRNVVLKHMLRLVTIILTNQ
uniref:Type I interferon e6 n=1 Tax=Oncorhynchus mykiss TaxID=8022 RepID=T2K1I5_ONCMY|nr:type I interferon e6 [Oncorhynchus mykiss]